MSPLVQMACRDRRLKCDRGPLVLPPGMVAWNTGHGVEFNVLLNYGPFLLQPVVQYYANVGGIGGHAVVAGFQARRFWQANSSRILTFQYCVSRRAECFLVPRRRLVSALRWDNDSPASRTGAAHQIL
jgi:hypothetical protein